jgi:hypothetical protein
VPLDDQGRRLEAVNLFDQEPPDPAAQDDAIPDRAPAVGGPVGLGTGVSSTRFGGVNSSGGGAGGMTLPVPVPLPVPDPRSPPALGALARRRQLREQNSEAVADLARMTGKSHAEMNGELNRRVRIRRISEATVRQLQQRLELARKMLRG